MSTIKCQINKRKLVSFSGFCPLNCKHCYTFDLPLKKAVSDRDEIEDILSSLDDGESFDVVYVSRSRENFIDEEAGVTLVEEIYNKYKKHIFIITRKCLSNSTIRRLAKLNEEMRNNSHLLAIALSIPANSSYSLSEDVTCIDTPENRCGCLKELHVADISTVFMARPIFPDRIIPVEEIIDLIKAHATSIDAVVASGLAVNSSIISRLQMEGESFKFLPGDNAEFLIGSNAKDINYIDVSYELKRIQDSCEALSLPFSSHSMQALNYLIDRM